MTRYHTRFLALASLSLAAMTAPPARGASVVQVDRGTWKATGVPDYVTMYIYVPDKLADKPPIVVACHSCGTKVSGYVSSISGIQAAADKNGFVLILPEATGRNCWDVGTTKSLSHDGGGDTQAIAQMVKYALGKYNGDAARVYAMGGSSGAMMTQALMAVYPDVFRAGSARAGVAAGCWADGFDGGQQWSNNCAGGNTNKSAQQWGDGVRAMYMGFTGHRPRIQLFHGDADATINYKNLNESTEEWTNVLALSDMPASTDMTQTSISKYNRKFWKNSCGYTVFETWTAPGGGHSMGYEQDAILEFFGLDIAGGADPEPNCTPGAGGSGGAGSGGTSAGGTGSGGGGAGGASSSGGGLSGDNGGTSGAGMSVGGTSAGGTSAPRGGAASSAGGSGSGAGSAGTGIGATGPFTNAGSAAQSAGTGSNPSAGSEADSGGCSVSSRPSKTGLAASVLGLVLAIASRRRRRIRHR